jgi:hypothetical protein
MAMLDEILLRQGEVAPKATEGEDCNALSYRAQCIRPLRQAAPATSPWRERI